MESQWAIGVSVAGRRLVIDVEDSSNRREQIPLTELYRRGVPDVLDVNKRRLTTQFEQWHRVPPEEYAAQFKAAGLPALPRTHHVFSVQVGGRRCLLVPSLVLMRAIFRPSKHILPRMFMPHALDQMSHLDVTHTPPVVATNMTWATPSARRKFKDWSVLLMWLHIHTCARRMAASIHECAMKGELGLVLPTGRMSFTASGPDVGPLTVATKMQIMSIAPSTPPDVPGVDYSGEYALHGHASRPSRPAVVSASRFQVPVRPDGSTDVSDAEWAEIDEILRAHRRLNRQGRYCQRQLMNDVLRILATECPWRDSKPSSGGWWTVTYSFRAWSQNGAMAKIIDVLHRHRSMY